MNIKSSFKSVFVFLLSLTIIGCGGGSSIESTLNPVLINVIGLVDNDFSYSTQDQLKIIDLLNEGYTFREVKSMTGFSHSSIGLIAKSNFK